MRKKSSRLGTLIRKDSPHDQKVLFDFKKENLSKVDINYVIKNQPGFSLFLLRHIRSSSFNFTADQISFMLKIKQELLRTTKFLHTPSEKFILKNLMELPETIFSKQKTLFLQINGILVDKQKCIEVRRSSVSGINFRPGWKTFLSNLSQYFDIFIYTSLKRQIAKSLARQIEGKIESFHFMGVISEEGCYKTKMGKLIKDLRLFENKKIEDMVILDSSAYSFSFQLDNGIPILEWDKSMRDDQELFRVMEVLIDIAHLSDLRQGLRNKLKLREIAQQVWQFHPENFNHS